MKIYSPEGIRNIAGKRIKIMREKYGWSQSILAAKLQLENIILEQKAISKIELGSRIITDYELAAMAKILNVTVDWLLACDIKKAPI